MVNYQKQHAYGKQHETTIPIHSQQMVSDPQNDEPFPGTLIVPQCIMAELRILDTLQQMSCFSWLLYITKKMAKY